MVVCWESFAGTRGDEEGLEIVVGVRMGKVGRDVLAGKRHNRRQLHETRVESNVNQSRGEDVQILPEKNQKERTPDSYL